VVAIGKQLLITRGALTTFSIANDVAKYFAIIPAMFMATYPVLGKLNIMGLHTPQSAILSAVIFNALIIIALVPLALRGVKYRPSAAPASLLRRNLLVYGVGGIIVPFPGIWLIDQIVHLLHAGVRRRNTMWKQLLPGLRITLTADGACGPAVSRRGHGPCQLLFPTSGQRKPDFEPRPCGRLGADRPELHAPGIFSAAAFGGRQRRLRPHRIRRSNLGPDQPEAGRSGEGVGGEVPGKENPGLQGPIPSDLLTASASGLDPHVSPASAEAQAARVAAARHIGVDQVQRFIAQYTEGRDLGFLGEPRVNVLRLNLALDEDFPLRK
jgi:hypothetical protein